MAESEDIDPENAERSKGFLTERDRLVLMGEKEPSSKYKVRHDIRKRTQHAYADFELLNRYMDEEEKKKTLRPARKSGNGNLSRPEPNQSAAALGTVLQTGDAFLGEGSEQMMTEALGLWDDIASSAGGTQNDGDALMFSAIVEILSTQMSKSEAIELLDEYWEE